MVISLFLSLAALIASFSMISVLALLISQKRREIGMLLALGLSKKRTQDLFRNIGLCLSALGLGIGVIVGSGLSYYLELYPLTGILPDIYYDSQIPAYLDGKMVLALTIVGFGLAFVGSSWMSRQASQESPSEALRQKV
jgi:lipoprotein-releasing system permease protein